MILHCPLALWLSVRPIGAAIRVGAGAYRASLSSIVVVPLGAGIQMADCRLSNGHLISLFAH